MAAAKKITIEQIGSTIGRVDQQAATLKGLGLGKIRRQSTLEDSASVRGMINSVKHLVRIVEEKK